MISSSQVDQWAWWEIIFLKFMLWSPCDVKFSRFNIVSVFITIRLFHQKRRKKLYFHTGVVLHYLYQSLLMSFQHTMKRYPGWVFFHELAGSIYEGSVPSFKIMYPLLSQKKKYFWNLLIYKKLHFILVLKIYLIFACYS